MPVGNDKQRRGCGSSTNALRALAAAWMNSSVIEEGRSCRSLDQPRLVLRGRRKGGAAVVFKDAYA
jgi:hypothetical protein